VKHQLLKERDKTGSKRELVAFSVFLVMGMALTIPQVYGIRPFRPNAPIEALFKPLAELLEKP